jgi:hypothetical protein
MMWKFALGAATVAAAIVSGGAYYGPSAFDGAILRVTS